MIGVSSGISANKVEERSNSRLRFSLRAPHCRRKCSLDSIISDWWHKCKRQNPEGLLDQNLDLFSVLYLPVKRSAWIRADLTSYGLFPGKEVQIGWGRSSLRKSVLRNRSEDSCKVLKVRVSCQYWKTLSLHSFLKQFFVRGVSNKMSGWGRSYWMQRWRIWLNQE